MSETRTRILEAASELFAQGGTSSLSVRAISDRAGLSTIGIYNHFGGKQGILDWLYIRGFDLVAAAIDIDPAGRTPKQAVLQGLKNYIDMANRHSAYHQLIFGQGEPGYIPSDTARVAGIEAFRRFVRLVAPAIPLARGRVAAECALQLWTLAYGYIGLRDHAATGLIPSSDWNMLTVQAVEVHLDALIGRFGEPQTN